MTALDGDGELLRRYSEEKSEEAFTELVRRHVDLVYSAALRQVNGDAHLAQDVELSRLPNPCRVSVPRLLIGAGLSDFGHSRHSSEAT